MAGKSDVFPGLSANRLCRLTGVRRQTRATWVKRRLVHGGENFGRHDLIEQTLVKALLDNIPKGQVPGVWRRVRSEACDLALGERAALVWDTETLTAVITRTDAQLSDAVRHGRAVHVLPLGELIQQ